MKCDRQDIENGVGLISQAVADLNIDVRSVIKQIYANGEIDGLNRHEIKHLFVEVRGFTVPIDGCYVVVVKIQKIMKKISFWVF